MDQQPITPQQPIQPTNEPINLSDLDGPLPSAPAAPFAVVDPATPAAPEVALPGAQPLQPIATTPQPQPIPEQPQTQPQAAPQVFGMPTGAAMSQDPAGQMGQATMGGGSVMPPKKSRSVLKIALLTLLGVGVLAGGSAAAYFGVVVPNKPENVLKAAVMNTLEQKSVTAKMNLEAKITDVPAFKAEATIKSDTKAKASSMDMKVTVSGVSLTGEMRYVDKSAYMKVGDFSNITDLVDSFAPEYGSQVNSINDKVADKWYEIDSTIIKEANADCALDIDSTLTDADYELITKLFEKSPFVTIASTANDTVDGKPAIKYVLNIDSKKSESFIKGLDQTSVIKKLNECDKQAGSISVTGDQDITKSVSDVAASDAEIMPITIWVNKGSKLITKFATETTDKQEKEGASVKVDMTMDYASVSIAKPEGAKPITTLLTDLKDAFPTEPVLGAKIERLIP